MASIHDGWPFGPILVDLRPVGPEVSGSVLSFASVTVPLGEHGSIVISGFSVLSGGNGSVSRVCPPARKGKSRYFDLVILNGDVRRFIEGAVISAYEREQASQNVSA
jgi:hypothetical protein